MKKYLPITVIIFIILVSCMDKENRKPTSPFKTSTEKPDMLWQNWKIQKGALGPLKIGARIRDYKEALKGLDSISVDAFLYKYDGGGVAYEYSYKKAPCSY